MPDYNSDAGLSEHLQIQAANIDKYDAEVGANPAVVQQLKDDSTGALWIINHCLLANEFKTTSFGIKRTYLRGGSKPIGDFSDAPDTTPPVALLADVEKRSRDRDQEFLHHSGTTQAAIDALDLPQGGAPPPSPDSVTPTVQAFGAKTGYHAAIVVSDRGEANAWDVYALRKGTANWTFLITATGKSVDVHFDPLAPGDPEQMQIRVQLKKNNQNYGEPSDPVYLTINP